MMGTFERQCSQRSHERLTASIERRVNATRPNVAISLNCDLQMRVDLIGPARCLTTPGVGLVSLESLHLTLQDGIN